jgi:hemerythrin
MELVLTAELLTGYTAIDQQHGELFDRANAVLGSNQPIPSGTKAQEMLQFLTEYVGFHFGEEEGLMSNMDYPDRHAHVGQHVYFMGEVETLRSAAQAQGFTTELSAKLAMLMGDWFTYHIKHSDKKLAAFIRGESHK